MLKTVKRILIVVFSAAMLACALLFSACSSSKHPRAEITYEFNGKQYAVEYTLYRNMYPLTVRHFIELAEAGYYDGTIIHNYTSGEWYAGGYSYTDEYSNASSASAAAAYLEGASREQTYYDLFNAGKITPTVYSTVRMSGEKEEVSADDALPTLIGEFSDNGHTIKNGALTADFGTLKSYYYSKSGDNKICYMKAHDGGIYASDYKYNSATGLIAIQASASATLTESNYCVFARLRNDGERETFEDLQEAINDYSDSVTTSFTRTVTGVSVDTLDTFQSEDVAEQTFYLPRLAIKIVTVKITKR